MTATERMTAPLKTRLVGLIYLAEVEYYRPTGQRLTKLDWKFHHFGPYAPSLAPYLDDPDDEFRQEWPWRARSMSSPSSCDMPYRSYPSAWGIYYLAWKFLVGFLNEEIGIA
jgi:hypothetical protein